MKLRLWWVAMFLLVAATAMADYYTVNVSRLEKDVYKDHNSGLIIITQWCYEYATREDAVLKYEQHSYSNKLIFESGESCDVKKVVG
jgi:hypothetical protein